MNRIAIVAILGTVILNSAVEAQTGLFNSVGIGAPPPNPPSERLRIDQGNILLNSTDERGLQVRRFGDRFPSGPMFTLGRIENGGDGNPNFRIFYFDNSGPLERKVLEFDSEGTVASVKRTRGSHFEGFLQTPGMPGDEQPIFRLNSSPEMQLELGPGGNAPTDVFIRRCGAKCVIFPAARVAASSFIADELLVRNTVGTADEIRALLDPEAVEALERLTPVMLRRSDQTVATISIVRDQVHSLDHSDTNGLDVSAVEAIGVLIKIVKQQQRRLKALEQQIGESR